MEFYSIDPLAAYGDFARWKEGEFPCMICFQGLKLILHCFHPFLILRCLSIGVVGDVFVCDSVEVYGEGISSGVGEDVGSVCPVVGVFGSVCLAVVINLHPSKLNMSGPQDEIPPPPPPPPSSSQTPTQPTPHTVSTIKLPILKKGEYDIWAMKMEHYLAHTDYPIWEVI
ncbi:hypothetical protein Tco_0669793 [Tanacetum coccineum]